MDTLHDAMAANSRTNTLLEHGLAGAVAGVPAGLVMAAFLSFSRDARALGPSLMLRSFGDVISLPTVAAGLVLHLVCSIGFGMLFSWIVRPTVTAPDLMSWATFYGVGVFLVMTYVVLPLVHPPLYAFLRPQPWGFFIAHLLYGMTLGFVLAAWRTRRRRWSLLRREQSAES